MSQFFSLRTSSAPSTWQLLSDPHRLGSLRRVPWGGRSGVETTVRHVLATDMVVQLHATATIATACPAPHSARPRPRGGARSCAEVVSKVE